MNIDPNPVPWAIAAAGFACFIALIYFMVTGQG